MSYPVILKKNNKPLKEFNTIKELAEFINWDYHLLWYYIKKNKKTEEGFTFKINIAEIKKRQKNLTKKLYEHGKGWSLAKTIQTAKWHAEQYLCYATEILEDPQPYKNTIRKMLPIPITKPHFNYLNSTFGIVEYNVKLAEMKNQISQVRGRDLVTINNLHEKFKTTIKYISPEHLKEYLTIQDGQISFKKNEILKATTVLLSKEDRVSIACIKSLMEYCCCEKKID
jgi:hypothetical protein